MQRISTQFRKSLHASCNNKITTMAAFRSLSCYCNNKNQLARLVQQTLLSQLLHCVACSTVVASYPTWVAYDGADWLAIGLSCRPTVDERTQWMIDCRNACGKDRFWLVVVALCTDCCFGYGVSYCCYCCHALLVVIYLCIAVWLLLHATSSALFTHTHTHIPVSFHTYLRMKLADVFA